MARRKRYSAEFKRQALKRADEPGVIDALVCEELGVSNKIWLVSFMQYDLEYFDHETCRLESIDNPFQTKVLPMSPV